MRHKNIDQQISNSITCSKVSSYFMNFFGYVCIRVIYKMNFHIIGHSHRSINCWFSDPLLYSAGSGQTSVSTNLLCSLRRDVCTERKALYFCCFPCLEVLLLPCLVLHILPRLQGLKCHSHYESFFCSPAWLAFGLPLLPSTHHTA